MQSSQPPQTFLQLIDREKHLTLLLFALVAPLLDGTIMMLIFVASILPEFEDVFDRDLPIGNAPFELAQKVKDVLEEHLCVCLHSSRSMVLFIFQRSIENLRVCDVRRNWCHYFIRIRII